MKHSIAGHPHPEDFCSSILKELRIGVSMLLSRIMTAYMKEILVMILLVKEFMGLFSMFLEAITVLTDIVPIQQHMEV